MLFNKLPQDNLGTGRRSVLHLCGCSSVGRARPRHGRGHEFETRHPLHFGCVHALRGHATWCWWSGMCAALGQAPCSETPHPTGCSRLGTAEVESRPRSSAGRAAPCKRRAARSNRRRGHQTCRVRLDGRGHHSFKVGTRVRLPHEAPDQFAEMAQSAERRVESACVGGSKPSLGTSNQNLVSSVGFRAPVYEAGGRTFESCTRCQQRVCGREADCGCL